MSKYVRFVSFMLVAVMLSLSLSVAPTMAQDEESDEVITIRYLTPQWASSRDGRVERQIAFQSVIDSFHLANPNIRLQEVVYDGSQVTAAQEILSGEIDAIWINNFWYPEWQRAGYFADLTPYLPEGEEAEFFDWTIEELRSINGELGALWHNTDTPIFFYRSDVLDEAPQTWSELREAAEAFRAENPRDYLFTMPMRNWFQLNAGMYAALGGELVDEDGRPVLFEEGNREIWEAMFEFFVGLGLDNMIPSEAAVNTHDSQMPLVYTGDVAAFYGNNNMFIRALQPNLPPDELDLWEAAPLPRPDDAEAGLYVAGGWVIALVASDDEARQEAAARWVYHSTAFNANRDTNKAGGWVPTRPAVIEQDPFYSEDRFMQVTLAALNEGGYVRPFTPLIGVITEQMALAMASAFSGEASISEALQSAESTIMAEYEALLGGS